MSLIRIKRPNRRTFSHSPLMQFHKTIDPDTITQRLRNPNLAGSVEDMTLTENCAL